MKTFTIPHLPKKWRAAIAKDSPTFYKFGMNKSLIYLKTISLYCFTLLQACSSSKTGAASSDMQELERTSRSAQYGAEIQVPCGYQGVVAMTFTRQNDSTEYYKTFSVERSRCYEGDVNYRVPFKFYLKEGTWTPRSVGHVPKVKLNELSSTRGADIIKFIRNSPYERDIQQDLSFIVDKPIISRPFLYIGAFQLQLNPANQIISSAYFRRDFAVRDFRVVFRERQAYNGYTGERIIHDKVLGTISVLFNQISPGDSGGLLLANTRSVALDRITDCVGISGKMNPLFEANGSVLLRTSESNHSLKKTEFKFTDSQKTTQKFKRCLESKFVSSTEALLDAQLIVFAKIYGL